MKLTRSKLREIVKEEIENLRESKYDIFVGKHVTGHTVADRSVEDPNTRDYKKLAFVYNDGRVQWYDKAAKKDREVKKTVDKLVKQTNESTRLTDILSEQKTVFVNLSKKQVKDLNSKGKVTKTFAGTGARHSVSKDTIKKFDKVDKIEYIDYSDGKKRKTADVKIETDEAAGSLHLIITK